MKTSVSEAEGMPAARRFCLPSCLEPQKKKPWHISRHKQTHFYKPHHGCAIKEPCIACSQLESTPFRASGCLEGWVSVVAKVTQEASAAGCEGPVQRVSIAQQPRWPHSKGQWQGPQGREPAQEADQHRPPRWSAPTGTKGQRGQ